MRLRIGMVLLTGLCILFCAWLIGSWRQFSRYPSDEKTMKAIGECMNSNGFTFALQRRNDVTYAKPPLVGI